ncbi:hypothetical protein P3T24_006279 [Paraburkholderia sp. GAS33]|jgi:hypothetical protein
MLDDTYQRRYLGMRRPVLKAQPSPRLRASLVGWVLMDGLGVGIRICRKPLNGNFGTPG